MSKETSVQVQDLNSSLPNDGLWGSFKVKGVEGSRLQLMGWALGKSADVERIEILAAGRVVASTVPSLPRPEIASEFPDRAAASSCGFEVTIEAQGKGVSVLELRAAMSDGGEVQIGRLQVVAPARRWSGVFRRS